jgi:positive control factor
MKDLIIQYEYGLANLRKENKILKDKKRRWKRLKGRVKDINKLEIINKRYAALEAKVSSSNSMISEMQDDIQHMKTGKRPGARRGVENLAAYQREISIDPVRFLHIKDIEEEVKSEEEITLLEGAVEELLWFLSKRQKDIYMLFAGYNFSVQQIVDLTGIDKGEVYKALDRARKKIKKNIDIDKFFS